MDKYQNTNKKDARTLTIITFTLTVLWLCLFYFRMTSKTFNDTFSSPGILLILAIIIFMITSLVIPFIAIYYWHLENFSIKSKFVASVIFSVSPWILFILLSWIFEFISK